MARTTGEGLVSFAERLRQRREALGRYHQRLLDEEYDFISRTLGDRAATLTRRGHNSEAARMRAFQQTIRSIQKDSTLTRLSKAFYKI